MVADSNTRKLNRNFCEQAVAYVKPGIKEDGPVIELEEGAQPVITNLNNGLLVAYLVDQGSHFQYVAGRHLSSAGLMQVELHQRAVLNLDAMLESNGFKLYEYGDCFQVILDGNFEASLILVDRLWETLLAKLAPNGFLAAIPSRDIMVFSDVQSVAGRASLRQAVIEGESRSHPITPNLYRRDAAARRWSRYAD
ncbi:MAG: DUF1444 family protein [Hyphomicrobiales bacterium]|nr:DUF1444 family protein [Hyphomicrobiales bacterium]